MSKPLVALQSLTTVQTANDGHGIRMHAVDTKGVELAIDVPFEHLGKLIDWGANGWNVCAKHRGLRDIDRLTFELQAVEIGNVIDESKKGAVIISMQLGEAGLVSYVTSPDLAWALYSGLRIQLEPDTVDIPAGQAH